MCTGFQSAHKLSSQHELVFGIKWVHSRRGNLSARYPKLLSILIGTGGKDLEAEGKGLKEVNEVNAEVGESV